MNYKDKLAIVTGGTGALGRVIVRKLSDTGMTVYLPVQNMEHFKAAFDSSTEDSEEFSLRKIFALPCDASNETEVKEFVEDVISLNKKVDYLVNTVGGFHAKRSVADTDSELLEKQLKLNFFSTFYFSNACLKNMIANNYGRIVSIGAKQAIETTAGKFAYSFSKAGVINLMQTIAEECKEQNITTCTIIPSIIDTPANRESMQNQDFSKWVNPEDIADSILYLFSDSAKSQRGNVIRMFGKV